MKKLIKNEIVTITILADMVKIEQGSLSNYISGRRDMRYSVAHTLEKITGIERELWLAASCLIDKSERRRSEIRLRKRLGMIGILSEKKVHNRALVKCYNEYIKKNGLITKD